MLKCWLLLLFILHTCAAFNELELGQICDYSADGCNLATLLFKSCKKPYVCTGAGQDTVACGSTRVCAEAPLQVDEVCDYEEQACKDTHIRGRECDDGYKCVEQSGVNFLCGKTSKCELIGLKIGEQCWASGVFSSEGCGVGLSCTDEREGGVFGPYRLCEVSPTPRPTARPTGRPTSIYENNPYPVHRDTYDGYISVIGSKLLAIDYELKMDTTKDLDGIQFIVQIEVTDHADQLVYYNSHRYVKPNDSYECPVGSIEYDVKTPNQLDCPGGTFRFPETGYCTSIFQTPTDLYTGTRGTVEYRNSGFVVNPVPWNHCAYYLDQLGTGTYKHRKVAPQLTSTQRIDTRSQFIFTPAQHDIKWHEYGVDDIPDPADEPVYLKLTNFQDGSPLVISDILLKDHTGRLIRKVVGSDITVTGTPEGEAFVDQEYACPYSGTYLKASCPAFGNGACCAHDPEYTQGYNNCDLIGIVHKTITVPRPSGVYTNLCIDECNEDTDCMGFAAYSTSWSEGGVTCKMFSTVRKAKTVLNSDTGYAFSVCRIASSKSTRFPVVTALVSATNNNEMEVFDCTSSSHVDATVRLTSPTQKDIAIACSGSSFFPEIPYANPPRRIKVIDRAVVTLELDGREVEYVDIGVGATRDDIPSSYSWEVVHKGLVMSTGVFSSTNEKVNRRTITLNNAGDSDGRELFANQYKPEFLTLFDLLCNEESPEHWYDSNSVYTILERGGTTVSDLCLDAEGAYATRNPAIFNDVLFTYRLELDQTLESLPWLDGTKESFMEHETGNSLSPPTVDTVKAAIDFLISIDRMFDCSNTTDPSKLADLDTEFLAESLILEYRYPTRYKSWCDDLKYVEDMRYGGKIYNVGREGAPCVSNAMCLDSLICGDYYCTSPNVTTSSICPAATATIHPLYYGLKPPNPAAYACADAEVYTDTGEGDGYWRDESDDLPWSYPQVYEPSRPVHFPGGNPFIQYDNFFTNWCGGEDTINVRRDHFKDRGNFFQCANYYTSEISDAGAGRQQGTNGRDSCGLGILNPLNYFKMNEWENAIEARTGEYDRICPRKVYEPVRDVKYIRGLDEDNDRPATNVLPASFALSNGNAMALLADMLDAQCRFPNVDELSFSRIGVQNDLQCGDVEGCVWSDSLRQCVASRINVEANFCPLVSSDVQCKFTGFCAWNEEGENCYHPTASEFEYSEGRNKQNECGIIFDPVDCGKSSCIWDMVQQECFAEWDDVVQFNEEIVNSAILGSSNSKNDAKIRVQKEGEVDEDGPEFAEIGDVKNWPACSKPGKLYKGHQIDGGKWTYYPEPAENTFVAGYEPNGKVDTGMAWVPYQYGWRSWSETEKKIVTETKVFHAWYQRDIRKDPTSTNKLCFHKSMLYNETMCTGYGFRWNYEQELCWLDDDGAFEDVEGLISFAAPVYYWDVSFGHNVFNDPDEHDWDDMVNANNFDSSDFNDIKIAEMITTHGYQYMRLGCYTKITKAQCEYADGYDQLKPAYGQPSSSSDRRCLWLPKIEKCTARSANHNIYNSVFRMPTNVELYNTTYTADRSYATSAWDLRKRQSADWIDKNHFHWGSMFEPNYSPIQAEDLLNETKVCNVFTVYDECVLGESCYWDYDLWECKPALCNAVLELMPEVSLNIASGATGDWREAVIRSKACQRMKGCSLNPISHTCGPDPDAGFPKCPTGYKMVNNYMDAYVCPDGFVVLGDKCVKKENINCPWGVAIYKPTAMPDVLFRSPSTEGDRDQYGNLLYEWNEEASDDYWLNSGEVHKFKSSLCNPYSLRDQSPNAPPHHNALRWNKDMSMLDKPGGDQGTDVSCIKWGASTVLATEHRSHKAGDYSAANRAYCAALNEKYDACDHHVAGNDFVCITIRDQCVPRYISVESITVDKINEWIDQVVYREFDDPDPTTDPAENPNYVGWKLSKIFDYTDTVYNDRAEAYFTMYFTEADLDLIPGIKEKVLTSAQLEERFSEYYLDFPYKKLTGYRDFRDGEPYAYKTRPKYEPVYEVVTIPTLDLSALQTEQIAILNSDIRLDVIRCAFAEIYTNHYFTWREIQMASINERLDPGLHILIAAETGLLRNRFWDLSEHWSRVLGYLHSIKFENDDAYLRHIDDMLENDVAPADHNSIEALAYGYLTNSLSEEYIASGIEKAYETQGEIRGALSPQEAEIFNTARKWIAWTDGILDTQIGTTRFGFGIDIPDVETVFFKFFDFLEYRFGGHYIDVLEYEDVDKTIDIWYKRPKWSAHVEKSKVLKKVDVNVPFMKRSSITKNHLELGKLTLWKRLPPKPPTAPLPPKLKPMIPLPPALEVPTYKEITKVTPAEYDRYILETFKPKKRMNPVWVQNGAGGILGDTESGHASLKSKFSRAWEQHVLDLKHNIFSKGKAKKEILKRLNKAASEHTKKVKQLAKIRSKWTETIKLKNQLSATQNAAALLKHNLETKKFNKVLSAFSDSRKVFQTPTAKVTQTTEDVASLGWKTLSTRVPKVLAHLKFTKEAGAITQTTTKVSKLVKVIKVWKQSKLGLALKFMGKAFKVVFAALGWVDFAMTIMEVFNTIKFYIDNPKGCSLIDDFIGIPTDPLNAVANVFKPANIALRLRVFLLQDFDGFSKELRCAERLSWAMFNADGKYGIRDSRYKPPQCMRDVNYRELEYHFSDPIKGLNHDCKRDSDCKRVSVTGRCVYNRCVHDAHYIGMLYCKKKVNVDVVSLEQPFQRSEYYDTDYDAILGDKTPAKKYIVGDDEMLFGENLLSKCELNERYVEYDFDMQSTTGAGFVTCFTECDNWITNVDQNKETWMLTMMPANRTDFGVNQPCETTEDCPNLGICSSDHKCTPPIDCEKHEHCYGGYYLPGRLPQCKYNHCVDECEDQGCKTREECAIVADNECQTPPPTTRSPTLQPTTAEPTPQPTTGQPTLLPTASPVIPITPPPVYVVPPTNEPSSSPTPDPTTGTPTGHPSLRPTADPTTGTPTESPTVPGPFAGALCEMDNTVQEHICSGDDNQLYMADVGSVFEILEETTDYSTCLDACKYHLECVMVHVKQLQDRAISCTYYHTKAAPYEGGVGTRSSIDNIGCFEKNIPCVPTAHPTTAPTLSPTTPPPTTQAPTPEPTPEPTLFPTKFPSVSPTLEPSTSPTMSPSKSPSKSPSGSPSSSPSNSPSKSPSGSPSSSPSNSPSDSPSGSPSSSPSDSPTRYPTFSPTVNGDTPHPSASPTLLPSSSPSNSPSESPSSSPSRSPSESPSESPSSSPSTSPSSSPSRSPSESPSSSPSASPSSSPSNFPTEHPTDAPTLKPTYGPTVTGDTAYPTKSPSVSPSGSPTGSPTDTPSDSPTGSPTGSPTNNPTTGSPTLQPTRGPTAFGETFAPTGSPTGSPTNNPTGSPTNNPTTGSPTLQPTRGPTAFGETFAPSESPTGTPTGTPTGSPTLSPSTGNPSSPPSDPPTGAPIASPGASPSSSPTSKPTRSPITPPPTFDTSIFNVRCGYDIVSGSKLLQPYQAWMVVQNAYVVDACMEQCDSSDECTGFEYEPLGKKCTLFSSMSGTYAYSRAAIYIKHITCVTETVSPTSSPTEYVPRYASVSVSACNYEEIAAMIVGSEYFLEFNQNMTIQDCVDACDGFNECTYVNIENSTAGITSCALYKGYEGQVVVDSEERASVWFNKTIPDCAAPTIAPTPAPTKTCGYDVWENSVIDTTNNTFVTLQLNVSDCRQLCDSSSLCNGFETLDVNCTLKSEIDLSDVVDGNGTVYKKGNSSCVETPSPTTPAPTFATRTPTLRPTGAPVNRVTEAPTSSPTTSPTDAPTQTTYCNYARLPSFRPRAGSVYVTNVAEHNYTIEHTELSCTISCDSSTSCVAFSFFNSSVSCVFYHALGPIEFKPLAEPQVLSIKSQSCIIPHATELSGCSYEENVDQFVASGVIALYSPLAMNVSGVFECSDRCNQDASCKTFDYNAEDLTCGFYSHVVQVGSSDFYTRYVKNDPECATTRTITDSPTSSPTSSPTAAPSGTPTTSPTGTPTSAPTVDRDINIIIIIIEEWCTSFTLMIVIVYIVVCCGVCMFVCLTPPRDDEPMYQWYAIVPDSIEYSVEF